MISGLLEDGAYGERPGPLFDATLVGAVVSALAGATYGAVDLAPGRPEHGRLALLTISSQVTGGLLISISLPRLPAAIKEIAPLGAAAALSSRCVGRPLRRPAAAGPPIPQRAS